MSINIPEIVCEVDQSTGFITKQQFLNEVHLNVLREAKIFVGGRSARRDEHVVGAREIQTLFEVIRHPDQSSQDSSSESQNTGAAMALCSFRSSKYLKKTANVFSMPSITHVLNGDPILGSELLLGLFKAIEKGKSLFVNGKVVSDTYLLDRIKEVKVTFVVKMVSDLEVGDGPDGILEGVGNETDTKKKAVMKKKSTVSTLMSFTKKKMLKGSCSSSLPSVEESYLVPSPSSSLRSARLSSLRSARLSSVPSAVPSAGSSSSGSDGKPRKQPRKRFKSTDVPYTQKMDEKLVELYEKAVKSGEVENIFANMVEPMVEMFEELRPFQSELNNLFRIRILQMANHSEKVTLNADQKTLVSELCAEYKLLTKKND